MGNALEDFLFNPWTLGGLIVAVLILAGIAGKAESDRWEAFRTAHACKVVAHIRGHTEMAPGFSSSGSMTFTTITTPDKTGWLCDDGVTYYR